MTICSSQRFLCEWKNLEIYCPTSFSSFCFISWLKNQKMFLIVAIFIPFRSFLRYSGVLYARFVEVLFAGHETQGGSVHGGTWHHARPWGYPSQWWRHQFKWPHVLLLANCQRHVLFSANEGMTTSLASFRGTRANHPCPVQQLSDPPPPPHTLSHIYPNFSHVTAISLLCSVETRTVSKSTINTKHIYSNVCKLPLLKSHYSHC